jgi:hypothetical protein
VVNGVAPNSKTYDFTVVGTFCLVVGGGRRRQVEDVDFSGVVDIGPGDLRAQRAR